MTYLKHDFQIGDRFDLSEAIDQAIRNELDDKVPHMWPAELVNESFKSKIVEDVIAAVLTDRMAVVRKPVIRPQDIRACVSDRYDSYVLKKICGLQCGTEKLKGIRGFLYALINL